MRRASISAFGLVVIALVAATPSARAQDDDVRAAERAAIDEFEAARRAESDAYAHLEAERFCDALNAFLRAYDAFPNPEQLANAGRSARLAGDYERAMAIYARLQDLSPSDVDEAEAEAIEAENALKANGNRPCAVPTPPNWLEPEVDVVADDVADDDLAPTPDPLEQSYRDVDLKDPIHVVRVDDAGGLPVWVSVALGVGAGGALVTTAVGVALFGVGWLPFLQHEQAVTAIDDAEAAGDLAAAQSAHTARAGHEMNFFTWGIPLVVVGAGLAALAAVSAAGLAGGAVWAYADAEGKFE